MARGRSRHLYMDRRLNRRKVKQADEAVRAAIAAAVEDPDDRETVEKLRQYLSSWGILLDAMENRGAVPGSAVAASTLAGVELHEGRVVTPDRQAGERVRVKGETRSGPAVRVTLCCSGCGRETPWEDGVEHAQCLRCWRGTMERKEERIR